MVPAAKRWLWFIPVALFVVLLGLRVFSAPAEFGVVHFFLIAFLLGILLVRIFGFIGQAELAAADQLELGMLLLAASRVAVQVSGGMDSELYPLNYLVFALVVSVAQPLQAAGLFFFLVAIEALELLSARAWAVEYRAFLIHAGLAAAFGLLIGVFMHMERRARKRAEAVLRHLKQDATEFRAHEEEFKSLPALSGDDRNREAVRGVFRLDDAFVSALELLKKSLRPHTAALYWCEAGTGAKKPGSYRLREILSDSDSINADACLKPGEGLLGLAIEGAKLLNLGNHRNLCSNLVYYIHPPAVKSAMAACVCSGDRTLGLLVVDSLEQHAFGPEQEKVLACFADQVKDVYDHALLFQKTLVEASKFKGLTELSHKLNSTLAMEDTLNMVLRATAPILSCDLAVITLWSDEPVDKAAGNVQSIAAAAGIWSEGIKGMAFEMRGSLAGWVVAEKKYLSIGRLRERDRKTPVFSKKARVADAQSMLAYPLMLYDEALGSLVFLSERPDAFSSYDVQIAGLVADMAAASIANARLYRDMERRAITDGLTGLFNHRHFQEILGQELERAERHPAQLSVALFDLDHFKSINDRYGHPVGDTVLKSVAGVIQDNIRKIDLAARYGGEEFVVVLVNTDDAGAYMLAERIRKSTAKMVFGAGTEEFSITLSAGIASWPSHASRKEDLVEAADQALYRAKAEGRNRTEVYGRTRSGKRARA